jgi:hypothetical protein
MTETDNLARGNHVVPTEWAQELEEALRKARHKLWLVRRERNYLKDENKRLRDYYSVTRLNPESK